jgi:hypothetical protein
MPALLLLLVVGCSKDDSNLTGPVASDQQQKKVETSVPRFWEESLYIGEPAKPYSKSYPAVAKSGVKAATIASDNIVMSDGFENGFAGWTVNVLGTNSTNPGGIKDNVGAIRPEWAWYVGHQDPYTAYYPPFLSHNENLEHTGSKGASALENMPTYHQLYRDITLPPIGDLKLEFWMRWKNSEPLGYVAWADSAQDIIVTLRDPANGNVLKTLFQASSVSPALPRFSGVGGSMAQAFYVQQTAVIRDSQHPFPYQTVRLRFDMNGALHPLLVDLDDILIIQSITNNPPIANAGPDQTVECTSHSGATAMLDGSGSSDVDNDPLKYAWMWAGGSASDVKPTVTLPLGSHEITLTVDDGKGGTATDVVAVNVVDTTPPVISLNGPSDVTLECPATYADPVKVSDACDPSPSLTVEGTVDGHTLGTYTLKYTAKDANGNESTAIRTVKVVDTTPPTITLNGREPLVLECPAMYVERGAMLKDACDPSPTLTIEGTVDGGTLGTYTVTYTATDHAGNTATATRTVVVQDTKAPTLSCSVSTPLLWPRNDKFVNVGLQVNVTDACDPNPKVRIKVYSDEDSDKEKGKDKDKGRDNDKGRGDDKDSPDAEKIGAGTLQLRAECSGKGGGRVYLIVVTATDKSHNTSFSSCTVVVPHSESKKAIADVNAQAAAAKASSGPNGSPLTPYLIGSHR